ncbi:MAG: tetratricopeptide repeat protein, partial [Acetobacteraceae bacterium]|nr:tetratricopeptide repeat protein [Acetobacteraceae bacterium]
YPNNPNGYYELGYLRRTEGRYDEAVPLFAKALRHNPRGSSVISTYWNLAYNSVYGGHDREGLAWADRALAAAGSLPPYRISAMLKFRIVGAYRTGDVETAERLAQRLNDEFPLSTWRSNAPDDPDSEVNREQMLSAQRALKAAGVRDHLDPETDFGVAPTDVLQQSYLGKTPTTAPGVTTINTEQLAQMLEAKKPLVIDTMSATWHRSVPGAVGLDLRVSSVGTFDDATQMRLERKIRELTGGNMGMTIVAMSFNIGYFDGYNLALRLRHAGYSNVYWYRGGREAWEVAGKPEEALRPADW